MKKLSVLLLFAVVPVLAYAQETRPYESRILINRIDQQISTSVRKDVLPATPQAGKSFQISFLDQSIPISASGGATSLVGTITLNRTVPVNINFHRTHMHLPDGWSTSICFGSSCYSTGTDSLPQPYTFTPQLAGSFTLDFYCPKGTVVGDSIVDYIKLNVQDGDPGDTVSFVLTGIFTGESAVLDQHTGVSGSPKIKAIYPSPLVQGNSIKVKVSSPRESNLSYSIFDGIGRVVALGVTRQRIILGDNTINIGSLDGLGNGSYMLKFNFGDGSSDSHFFQIMR